MVGRWKRKRGRKSGKEVGRKVEKMRKKGERDGREELERGRKEWGRRRRGCEFGMRGWREWKERRFRIGGEGKRGKGESLE